MTALTPPAYARPYSRPTLAFPCYPDFMPLSITRPRIRSVPAVQSLFGEKIFSIHRIITEKPGLRRSCPSENFSIDPAFMTQKNIAFIDNSYHKPVSLTHPLPAGAPNARHAQPQFSFNQRRIGFAASTTSRRRNSLIWKIRSFRTKNILFSAKIPAKNEIVPITRVIRPSSRQIRPIGQQSGPKWSRLSVHSVSFPSLLAVSSRRASPYSGVSRGLTVKPQISDKHCRAD